MLAGERISQIYLKGRERSFFCLFIPQITKTARTGLVPKPEARSFFQFCHMIAGRQSLEPSSAASLGHQQGAGSAVEQLGQVPMSIWNAGVAGKGLAWLIMNLDGREQTERIDPDLSYLLEKENMKKLSISYMIGFFVTGLNFCHTSLHWGGTTDKPVSMF